MKPPLKMGLLVTLDEVGLCPTTRCAPQKPEVLQNPRMLDFLLRRKGCMIIVASSSCRCLSAKSKMGSNHSSEYRFHGGIDEGETENPCSGRPSDLSTVIRSAHGCLRTPL